MTSTSLSLTSYEGSREGVEVGERDLGRVIEGNRKLYRRRNFRYHPVDGELEIIKRLVLKSIEKVQRWVNPVKRIRVFDYEIYSDTTVILDNVGSREIIPPFTLDSFKRIVSITHDARKRTYKYLLEEKAPRRQEPWLGLENLRYTTKLLDSLGSKVAHDVSVSLEHFLDNLHEVNRKLSETF